METTENLLLSTAVTMVVESVSAQKLPWSPGAGGREGDRREGAVRPGAGDRVNVPLGVISGVEAVVGTVANVVLLVVVYRMKGSYGATRLMMASLGLADLLFAVFICGPTALESLTGSFVLGHVGCVVYMFVRSMMSKTSIFTFMAIAIER